MAAGGPILETNSLDSLAARKPGGRPPLRHPLFSNTAVSTICLLLGIDAALARIAHTIFALAAQRRKLFGYKELP